MFSDSIDLGGKFTYVLHQHKLGFGVKKVLHTVVEVEIQRFLNFKKLIAYQVTQFWICSVNWEMT